MKIKTTINGNRILDSSVNTPNIIDILLTINNKEYLSVHYKLVNNSVVESDTLK